MVYKKVMTPRKKDTCDLRRYSSMSELQWDLDPDAPNVWIIYMKGETWPHEQGELYLAILCALFGMVICAPFKGYLTSKLGITMSRIEGPGRSIFPTWSIWDIHLLPGHVSKLASEIPFWLFSDFVSANLAINLTYKIRYVWSDTWQFARFLRLEIFQLWSFELSFGDLISAGWWEAFPLWKFHCILMHIVLYVHVHGYILKIKH